MFERFKHRSYDLERLDTGDYTAAEYAHWQREMQFIHRLFGETRAMRNSLLMDIRSSGRDPVSVLDVGAGSGELLFELQKWTSDIKTTLVGVEINTAAARSIRRQNIHSVQADALRLPFADDSFDYAFCTLLLHHLGDEAAVNLLREMGRVARERIFVIDLNRRPVPYYFYRIVGRLFLQRLTLEDGALSILRSFSPAELYEMAGQAGLSDVNVKHSAANRLVLTGRRGEDD